MSRPLLRGHAKEKVHLVVADLHHVGLLQTPEHPVFGLSKILPERGAEVGVEGNQLPGGFGVGHRRHGGLTGRGVGEGEGAEVEDSGPVNEGEIQLLLPQAGIRTRLAGKGEGALPLSVQSNESQGGEHRRVGDKTGGGDAGLLQSGVQQSAKGVLPHLGHQGGLCPELAQSGQKIGRCAPGVGGHGGVALPVRGEMGEVDEHFPQSHNVIHHNSSCSCVAEFNCILYRREQFYNHNILWYP